MYRMMQLDAPQDLVIATGETRSLRDFVASVFASLDLDWQAYVDIEPALFRATDITRSGGNPERAASTIEWRASVRFDGLIDRLVRAELEREA